MNPKYAVMHRMPISTGCMDADIKNLYRSMLGSRGSYRDVQIKLMKDSIERLHVQIYEMYEVSMLTGTSHTLWPSNMWNRR